MKKEQTRAWVKNKDCALCKVHKKNKGGKLGDVLIKNSLDGKRHRHLTKKELEKIFLGYPVQTLEDFFRISSSDT